MKSNESFFSDLNSNSAGDNDVELCEVLLYDNKKRLIEVIKSLLLFLQIFFIEDLNIGTTLLTGPFEDG